MICFREGLIAESDIEPRQHLSIRSGNKMYPLLGPLTRDIVCRLDQFEAAGMTGSSAKMARIMAAFPQPPPRDYCENLLSSFQPSESL